MVALKATGPSLGVAGVGEGVAVGEDVGISVGVAATPAISGIKTKSELGLGVMPIGVVVAKGVVLGVDVSTGSAVTLGLDVTVGVAVVVTGVA